MLHTQPQKVCEIAVSSDSLSCFTGPPSLHGSLSTDSEHPGVNHHHWSPPMTCWLVSVPKRLDPAALSLPPLSALYLVSGTKESVLKKCWFD
jgi:hypothetical protein